MIEVGFLVFYFSLGGKPIFESKAGSQFGDILSGLMLKTWSKKFKREIWDQVESMG